MKRSEAIKDIVAKSYMARTKVLNEAEKGRGFSPDDNTAVGAPSAAGPSTGGAIGSSAGASGGGGNSTAAVRVLPLTKPKAVLVVKAIVLAFPSDIKKGNLDDMISAIAKDKQDALDQIAGDPSLEEADIRETLPIEKAELEFEEDPFGEDNGEEEVLKESIPEEEFLKEKEFPIITNSDGGPEVICQDDDYECHENAHLEVMNEYEVINIPVVGPADLILVVNNNEAIESAGKGRELK